MDKLDKLFDLQEKFQIRLENLPFKTFQDKQQYINLMTIACQDELLEALRETSWKNPSYIKGGWKKTQEYDENAFKEELIDVWHFLINLSIGAGLTSQELYDAFLFKHKENNKRQDDKY